MSAIEAWRVPATIPKKKWPQESMEHPLGPRCALSRRLKDLTIGNEDGAIAKTRMSFQAVDKDPLDRFRRSEKLAQICAAVCSASGAPQLKTTIADDIR